MSPQAQSIDEVIAILQDIIQESLKEKSMAFLKTANGWKN
jgi:hypothetical protein